MRRFYSHSRVSIQESFKQIYIYICLTQLKSSMWLIETRQQLRVAYNSIFRKIFSYRWSESVTPLQQFLSRPTWEELVDKRKRSFVESLRQRPFDSLPRAILP